MIMPCWTISLARKGDLMVFPTAYRIILHEANNASNANGGADEALGTFSLRAGNQDSDVSSVWPTLQGRPKKKHLASKSGDWLFMTASTSSSSLL